ncbi:MAG: efflux RND transporter periplasmic adaptor subunit [Burkholderiaceae bacterium]
MRPGYRGTVVIGIVLIALAAGGYLTYQRRAKAIAAHPTPAAAAASGAPANAPAGLLSFGPRDLIRVAPTRIARSIPLTGTLRPVNQTVLRAKVAGEICELPVREGSVVKAGQLIARIDPVDFEYRIKEREAQLRQIEAQLAQARRSLDDNTQLLARHFISQSAHDNARYAYEALLGARDAAGAQLTMARKSLRDATVTAPFSGVIAERFAQPGEKVSPDNRLVSLVDLSRMEIEAPVPASEIGAVAVGQDVTLHIEGIDTPQLGQVVRIAPGTQAGTRSIPVYIGLDNRDPRIRAGLFAQGRLVTAARDGAIVVPEAAVRDVAGRLFVYAIDGDRLVERDVRVGLRDAAGGSGRSDRDPDGGARTEAGAGTRAGTGTGTGAGTGAGAGAEAGTGARVEITEGLQPGELIVAADLGTLRAGSPVRVDDAARP